MCPAMLYLGSDGHMQTISDAATKKFILLLAFRLVVVVAASEVASKSETFWIFFCLTATTTGHCPRKKD